MYGRGVLGNRASGFQRATRRRNRQQVNRGLSSGGRIVGRGSKMPAVVSLFAIDKGTPYQYPLTEKVRALHTCIAAVHLS